MVFQYNQHTSCKHQLCRQYRTQLFVHFQRFKWFQMTINFKYWCQYCRKLEIFMILLMKTFPLLIFCPQLPHLAHPSTMKKGTLFHLFWYTLSFCHIRNNVRHRRRASYRLVLFQVHRANIFQPHVSPPQQIHPGMTGYTVSHIPSQHLSASRLIYLL